MAGPFLLLFQCVFYDIDDLCSFSDFQAWYLILPPHTTYIQYVTGKPGLRDMYLILPPHTTYIQYVTGKPGLRDMYLILPPHTTYIQYVTGKPGLRDMYLILPPHTTYIQYVTGKPGLRDMYLILPPHTTYIQYVTGKPGLRDMKQTHMWLLCYTFCFLPVWADQVWYLGLWSWGEHGCQTRTADACHTAVQTDLQDTQWRHQHVNVQFLFSPVWSDQAWYLGPWPWEAHLHQTPTCVIWPGLIPGPVTLRHTYIKLLPVWSDQAWYLGPWPWEAHLHQTPTCVIWPGLIPGPLTMRHTYIKLLPVWSDQAWYLGPWPWDTPTSNSYSCHLSFDRPNWPTKREQHYCLAVSMFVFWQAKLTYRENNITAWLCLCLSFDRPNWPTEREQHNCLAVSMFVFWQAKLTYRENNITAWLSMFVFWQAKLTYWENNITAWLYLCLSFDRPNWSTRREQHYYLAVSTLVSHICELLSCFFVFNSGNINNKDSM